MKYWLTDSLLMLFVFFFFHVIYYISMYLQLQPFVVFVRQSTSQNAYKVLQKQ